MGSIGMQELIIIFLVVLLLFGSQRLPELARGLGKAMREFKKATSELKEELDMTEIDNNLKKDMKDYKLK
ncbi:MAG: twin-arginine translocase TatA/TatE family subunit [bacterium]